MTRTYVPQNYPLFVALDWVKLPSNIGYIEDDDNQDEAVRYAIQQWELRIERVVAWLIEDVSADQGVGGVRARPVTMFGLGIATTLAESPSRQEIYPKLKKHLIEQARYTRQQVREGKGNPS
jgi:hypothetical protein